MKYFCLWSISIVTVIMHNKEQGEKTELLFLFLWLKVSHKLYIPSKTSESFEYQITLHEMKHSMLWLLKNWRMLSENVLFYKCKIFFLKLTLKCPVGHQTHWNFKPTEEHSRRKERDIYNIYEPNAICWPIFPRDCPFS